MQEKYKELKFNTMQLTDTQMNVHVYIHMQTLYSGVYTSHSCHIMYTALMYIALMPQIHGLYYNYYNHPVSPPLIAASIENTTTPQVTISIG